MRTARRFCLPRSRPEGRARAFGLPRATRFSSVSRAARAAGASERKALLEVAEELTRTLPRDAVYVGLAMSVCVGSSLFLTAATSGPLAQSMVERVHLRDHNGVPLTFGFAEYLPVGLLSFALILLVALVTAALLSGAWG